MSSTEIIVPDASTSTAKTPSSSALAYALLATEPTIHVLSPTLVEDAIRATVQTNGSGIIGTITMPKAVFDLDNGGLFLNSFTRNLEAILADSRVSAVTSSPSLDASGLLQDSLTITVSYQPPGSTHPPLEVDVETGYADLRGTTDIQTGQVVPSPVATAIADAYQRLVTLAGG